MTRITVLDGMPPATALYARALSPRQRPPVSAGLPDRLVNLVHHRCEVAEVAAYDRVCGFTLTDRLPVTWLHVLTFPLQLTLMTASDFPLAPLGMVHVSNTMTQHRPVSITEPLELTVRAADLRPHRRGVLVDLVGEALVAGEPVWSGRSTYLNRSAKLSETPSDADPDGASADAADPSSTPPRRSSLSRPSEDGPDRPAEDGDETGFRQAQPSETQPSGLPTAGLWRLPSDLGRRYAAVSGDVNPIHLNPLAAKAFGLPRTIAHGMWMHARALAALQPRLPDSFEVSVQFTKPVLLPSTVRFAAAADADGFVAQLTNRTGEKTYLDLRTTTLH